MLGEAFLIVSVSAYSLDLQARKQFLIPIVSFHELNYMMEKKTEICQYTWGDLSYTIIL